MDKATAYLQQRDQAAIDAYKKMMRELPHLNTDPENGGISMYAWQWEFFLSQNRMLLLTAANQIGKSSIQIRKIIHWATEPELWPELWPTNHHNVAQFWYLYPTLGVATIEVKEKWIPEWLPRGSMKDDPQYGWNAEYKNKEIQAIHFNSGVTIYFKSYAQRATDLQTGTVHFLATDEELPINLYDELKFRTSASNGHFSMAFTATLGQFEWECAMEKRGTDEELFPKAHKIQVSLFDCLEYSDQQGNLLRYQNHIVNKNGQLLHRKGSMVKTPWTKEIIQERIESCSSKDEVAKRIYGRFVQSGGLKYSKFLDEKNILKDWVFDSNYHIYSATDPGSGGKDGHPSGIIFIAVSPDYKEGIVFLGWRGDGIQTTDGDTLNKYIEFRGKLKVATQWYDYKNKDFAVLGERIGEHFEKAEKSHDIGEPILKTLLKYNALKIVTGKVIGLESLGTETEDGELLKLIAEFRSLKNDTDKRNAKDDLIDPTRYICAKVPWDIEAITKDFLKNVVVKKKVEKVIKKTEAEIIKERRGMMMSQEDLEESYESEIAFWNDMM